MAKMISVFGSARIQPESDLYRACYDLGHALASSGYITMTGGYAGVMEATSRGASDGGGEVYGITVASLEYIGESRVNEWVSTEIKYDTLHERLFHLIEHADAYVIMPGGLGTGQELIEVWQGMRLGDLPTKPIIIYGNFWSSMIDSMLSQGFINARDMRLIIEASSTKGVLNALEDWFTKET